MAGSLHLLKNDSPLEPVNALWVTIKFLSFVSVLPGKC
jgi:hypothetical protein